MRTLIAPSRPELIFECVHRTQPQICRSGSRKSVALRQQEGGYEAPRPIRLIAVADNRQIKSPPGGWVLKRTNRDKCTAEVGMWNIDLRK